MSLAEHMETLNAAMRATMDITYRGSIKANTTDYPTFSDEQLAAMNILVKGFRGFVCTEAPITRCRGHRLPYLEAVIRYGDTLAIIEDDSMGGGNRWAKSERL